MGLFRARPCRRLAALCGAFLASVPLAAAGEVLVQSTGSGRSKSVDAADPTGSEQQRVRIEGTVLLPGGEPAGGAVVISSAGGSAAVREDGSFSLELALDPRVLATDLTAVANGPEGSLIAQRRLDGLRAGRLRHAGTLHLASSQGCSPSWIPTFGEQPGTSGIVRAFSVFDDGAGPALYVGGTFSYAGGVDVTGLAKWDGEKWSAVGGGMDKAVLALAVFDDGSGSGPALYAAGDFIFAGGTFANHIAKWDGQSWSQVGLGLSDTVNCLIVFDDALGGGPGLYAGGEFLSAAGLGANCIARWDGQSWSVLGSGTDGEEVLAMAVFDDGSGAALYAGGYFLTAGGQSVRHIAKWDGQSWSALQSGTNGLVQALTVFDDGIGAGPALYAGGTFTKAGGQDASRVARWDGQSWSAVGGGVSYSVLALVEFDDGSGVGPALYAGGFASGTKLSRWDGQTWSALPSEIDVGWSIQALAVFDDGSGGGPALYAGGEFWEAAGLDMHCVARWDGQAWSGLGTGPGGYVRTLAVFDDGAGGGPVLYVGGSFKSAGGQLANRIAKWDGQGWSALGSGVEGQVYTLGAFDDGSGLGPALYAGGTFTIAGGLSANHIARWDGQSWSALGSGMEVPSDSVRALAVFDDGSGAGPALYAGGHFSSAGGQIVNHIAKWDGQTWSALGSGVGGLSTAYVLALAVFDVGSGGGPALYAAGIFSSAGGQSANQIAKWDGQSWSPLGQGLSGQVDALAVFDDGLGAGSALYAAGGFNKAGGQPANSIAKWDGQSWSALSGLSAEVWALAVFDDDAGAGPALYAGGDFSQKILRWNGQAWSSLGAGSGMENSVMALTVFDHGPGATSSLFAGGQFMTSSSGDSFLARWGCPTISPVPGCFGNPAVLTSLSSERSIGTTLQVSLSSSLLATGLGLLFLGLDGTDGAGCGFLAPGLGELLLALAPPPKQVGSSPLSAGAAGFDLPVPADPTLVGITVALQGAAVGLFDPGIPIELSNALSVTVTQ